MSSSLESLAVKPMTFSRIHLCSELCIIYPGKLRRALPPACTTGPDTRLPHGAEIPRLGKGPSLPSHISTFPNNTTNKVREAVLTLAEERHCRRFLQVRGHLLLCSLPPQQALPAGLLGRKLTLCQHLWLCHLQPLCRGTPSTTVSCQKPARGQEPGKRLQMSFLTHADSKNPTVTCRIIK